MVPNNTFCSSWKPHIMLIVDQCKPSPCSDSQTAILRQKRATCGQYENKSRISSSSPQYLHILSSVIPQILSIFFVGKLFGDLKSP